MNLVTPGVGRGGGGGVHKSKGSEFLINQGVKVGATRLFLSEIKSWLEKCGRDMETQGRVWISCAVRVEILSYRINYLIGKL
jgi:hypothetical protein